MTPLRRAPARADRSVTASGLIACPAPERDEEASEDSGIQLDGGLSSIEFDARDVPPDDQNVVNDDASEQP